MTDTKVADFGAVVPPAYVDKETTPDTSHTPASPEPATAPPASGLRQRQNPNPDASAAASHKSSLPVRAGGAVAERAQRQVRGAAHVATEAVSSGAWWYPIRGALYIVSHPTLIGPVLPALLRAVAISAGIVAACFFFLYLPQVAWLALFTGPLGAFLQVIGFPLKLVAWILYLVYRLVVFILFRLLLSRFVKSKGKSKGIGRSDSKVASSSASSGVGAGLGPSLNPDDLPTGAFIGAVPLVLGEAYLILMFVGKNFLFGQLNVDLFDAVLVQKGHAGLVERQRAVTTKSSGGRQLGKLLSKPLNKFSTDNIVRYLLTLPLNLIPVVGTVFFLGYNGYKAGPSCHGRYFQLKGWDKSRRASFVERRRGAYTAFGVVQMLFNMIPVVGVFLQIASTVGAALWAAELEGKAPDQAGEIEVSIPAH